MSECKNNCGKPQYNLVFSCSGAADVGCIADRAARQAAKGKKASMCCIAAVAAEIPEIMEITRNARDIVGIDGCDKSCVKIILEKAGFTNAKYFHLGDLGMKKGESPFSDERLDQAVNKILQTLHA